MQESEVDLSVQGVTAHLEIDRVTDDTKFATHLTARKTHARISLESGDAERARFRFTSFFPARIPTTTFALSTFATSITIRAARLTASALIKAASGAATTTSFFATTFYLVAYFAANTNSARILDFATTAAMSALLTTHALLTVTKTLANRGTYRQLSSNSVR